MTGSVSQYRQTAKMESPRAIAISGILSASCFFQILVKHSSSAHAPKSVTEIVIEIVIRNTNASHRTQATTLRMTSTINTKTRCISVSSRGCKVTSCVAATANIKPYLLIFDKFLDQDNPLFFCRSTVESLQ